MEHTLLMFLKKGPTNLSEFISPFRYRSFISYAAIAIVLVLVFSMSTFAQLSQAWVTAPLVVQGKSNTRFIDQATDKNFNLLVLGNIGANSPDSRVVLHKVNEAGTILWSRSYEGEAGSISDYPSDLWLDTKGNSYITGISDMAGVFKSFLLRYSPDGTLVWSKSFDNITNVQSYIEGIAVGADDNIYLSGYRIAGEKQVLFTQKMSSDGNVIWEKLFEPESGYFGENSVISVDDKGGVFVTTDVREFQFNYHTILIKYDAASGNQVFVKKYGEGSGPYKESVEHIAVAPDGGIYLFTHAADVNDPYYRDLFMYTLSAGGELLKSARIGEGVEYRFNPIFILNKVAFADDGGIIVLCVNSKYRDVPDYFMEKYKRDGTRLWLKTFNIYEEQNRIRQFTPRSFTVMDDGNIAVIGSYSYFVAPPVWYEEATYIEEEKLTIVLFDQTGNEIWRDVNQTFNGSPNFGEGISVTRGNSAYVTGRALSPQGGFFAMKYTPATVAAPAAWVSQIHNYNQAEGTITVNWKLHISEAQPDLTKYNVYHASTESGELQNWVWDVPAGQTSVSGAYVYSISKIGSTKFLVMGLATGTGYTIPNTLDKPKEVKINVEEVTGSDAPTIATSALATSKICAAASVSVPFTTKGNFATGNIFTAQISNAAGSFVSPIVIGTGSASPVQATIPAGTAPGTGYRVRIVASSPATIGTDNGTNITITQAPAKPGAIRGMSSVCAGSDNITYTVEAVTGATGYNWSVTGFDIINGQGTRSITVKAGNNSGTIRVIATGECGNSAASELAVTVVQKPVITITMEGATNFCEGGYVTLKASTGTGYTYQWFKNNTAISGATGSSYAVNSTGSYTLRATNSTGCTTTSAATTVEVNTPFTVDAGANYSVCASAAAFNLTGYNPAGGTWSGNGVTAAGSFNPGTAGVGTHSLTYTVTKDNCTVSGTTIIHVLPVAAQPGAISGSSTVCAGANNLTYSVEAVTGAAEYIWTATGFDIVSGQGTNSIVVKADDTNGSLKVVAKNSCGNSAASEKAVTVSQLQNVAITATGSTSICEGGSVKLSVNEGSNYRYQWVKDGQNLAGATTVSYTATVGGSYTVVVSNGGCSSTTPAVAVSVGVAVKDNTISNNQVICAGTAAAALRGSNPSGGSGTFAYQWEHSANGTDFSAVQNATGKDYTPENLIATTWFRRKVTSGNCSSTSEAVKITVNAAPTISLGVFEAVCDNAEPISLTGGSPAGGTYSGSGVSNGTFDPKIAGPGTHIITYSYTDANTCSASATQSIVVKSDCSVTGVEDDEPLYKLQVFPNPTRSFVNIHLNLDKRSDLTIRMVDARGRIVMVEAFKQVHGEFKQGYDLKDKATGMYLLQFITEEGIKTRRIVVQ